MFIELTEILKCPRDHQTSPEMRPVRRGIAVLFVAARRREAPQHIARPCPSGAPHRFAQPHREALVRAVADVREREAIERMGWLPLEKGERFGVNERDRSARCWIGESRRHRSEEDSPGELIRPIRMPRDTARHPLADHAAEARRQHVQEPSHRREAEYAAAERHVEERRIAPRVHPLAPHRSLPRWVVELEEEEIGRGIDRS